MASINLQGDTSGSISISAPSVAGTNTLTLPATTQTLATQNALGVRNLIINGDMRINQRGFASSIDNSYTVDRFLYQSSQASKFTITQDTDTPSGQGFVNSLKFVTASAVTVGASDYFMLSQPIEGNNAAVLNLGTAGAKTFTLSFWTRSSLTGTFGGAIGNSAANRYYPFTYTIDSADTWERKTVTIAGDTTGTWLTNNGIGLMVRFGLGVGSSKSGTAGSWQGAEYFSATGATSVVGTGSATWYLTGVQLEADTDTATPFEHRPYDMELARCHRYCYQQTVTIDSENIMPIGIYDPSNAYTAYRFPVVMRSSPTFSTSSGTVFRVTYNGTNANITGGMTGGSASQYSVQMRAISSGMTTGAAAWIRGISGTTGQYIRFDAEL